MAKGYEIKNYAAARDITLFQALKELCCMDKQLRFMRRGTPFIVRQRSISEGRKLTYEAMPASSMPGHTPYEDRAFA